MVCTQADIIVHQYSPSSTSAFTSTTIISSINWFFSTITTIHPYNHQRVYNLCCSEIAVQAKDPQYYATNSNILSKVFGQEQNIQPHHWQRKLGEHGVYNTCRSFETGDGTISSSLHYWLDQEGSLHQDNKIMSCSYFNWEILSWLYCLWCGWHGRVPHSFYLFHW